ncbi:hypothetical protein [Companilactobacillus sp. HBUAS56257]|uniref:hypothetical protein n=1 Tax=Companilactobacillus sp. HBUAS56257 TaxID=3109360 RepID=UPI002FF217C1
MAESLIIVFLLGSLLIFEFQQQRTIKIKARSSKIKYIIAFVAAIAIVTLFWTESPVVNFKLIMIAVLFASVAFINQGLSDNKVITYGSISNASTYDRYDQIVVEGIKNGTMVTFGSKKGGSYSLIFDDNVELINKFIKKHVSKKVKVLSGEEFDRKLAIRNKKQEDLRAKQLEMIRNRPQRNKFVKPIVKKK